MSGLVGLTAPALATALDIARSVPNAAPFGTCPICGFYRPVYPEPDGTEVCLECYRERNGEVL